jgi:uncharacterized protein YdhG (YjbR/CyaY superfamily)
VAKAARAKGSEGFTAEERAAMRERAKETKAAAADPEAELRAKIAEMREPDRAMAERLHALIRATAPDLSPCTWYGMPAYAKGRSAICFFQPAQKFRTRYATLGFSDRAHLDDGGIWPTSYALKELTPAVEASIAALIKKAIG